MKHFHAPTILTLLLALSAPQALAAIDLPALIADHMVLQQKAPAVIWGRAGAGEKVTVALPGQQAAATADAEGKWRVELKPLPAGGPHEMTIAAAGQTVTLKDVLVGEVWVCSGQSNMALGMFDPKHTRQADHPDIRLFRVPWQAGLKPADDLSPPAGSRARWERCTPQSVVGFTAVGYFFGRDLHAARKVPVGLIQSCVGGTSAQMWVSEKALAADPALAGDLKRLQADYQRSEKLRAEYEPKLAAWQKEAAAARAEGKKPPARPYRPRFIDKYTTGLYNGMIHPLRRYRSAGAIWYQGEGNASSIGTATGYRRLLGTLIADWRSAWGCELPFLIVQLPNYKARAAKPADTAWARLRESQFRTLEVPATGLAVTIDLGEARNIHPANKWDVGARLALVARAKVYGEELIYSGPRYRSMKVEGGAVRLSFDHLGERLVVKGDKLTGFAVAGADRKFVWADARIDGDTVVVRSAAVPAPVAVRYAWADNPEVSLYNQSNLPAPPFRTDNWPPPSGKR